MTKGREFGWHYQVKSVSHPIEPVNYRGTYTTMRKRIVDTEIAMKQSSRTLLITTMEMLSLLKLTVSEEQEEEGGLRTYHVNKLQTVANASHAQFSCDFQNMSC